MLSLFDTTDEWKEAVANWHGIEDRPPKAYRKRSRGFQVLKNDFLEKYFATSPWYMPGVWFIPVVTAGLWDALGRRDLPLGPVLGLYTAGILGWTLVEYVLHRWLFHLPVMKQPLLKEIQYVLHGYHHEFPDDPGRLVAPPVLSWPIAAVLVALYALTMGPWWTTVFAGTVTGYLAYDWMHYYSHHGRPFTRAGRFMRRYHAEHHFKIANSQYGLSSPLWDVVFGTFSTTGALKPGKEATADDPT